MDMTTKFHIHKSKTNLIQGSLLFAYISSFKIRKKKPNYPKLEMDSQIYKDCKVHSS